ncbi:hypothetical protein A7A08_01710 [Methyloligella halotolerans]|uniref:Uncharacterized protein n=1 Tax=Methyloligella halotolerans TaxID=1177755 RepID=A0A1E2S017_9HYPH|nr:hypothetical protein A7A08_01710 [Methyloligella halotolerans]
MRAGQDPELFWKLTPRETQNILDGYVERLADQYNERAWLAWHTAWLTAYAPQKSTQFVKLKSLLHDAEPRSRPMQSMEEQISVAQMWAVALSGRG